MSINNVQVQLAISRIIHDEFIIKGKMWKKCKTCTQNSLIDHHESYCYVLKTLGYV